MSKGSYECQHGGLFLFRFGKVITLQEQCGDAQGPIFVNIYEVWVVVVLWYGGYSEGHVHGGATYTPCLVKTTDT